MKTFKVARIKVINAIDGCGSQTGDYYELQAKGYTIQATRMRNGYNIRWKAIKEEKEVAPAAKPKKRDPKKKSKSK